MRHKESVRTPSARLPHATLRQHPALCAYVQTRLQKSTDQLLVAQRVWSIL